METKWQAIVDNQGHLCLAQCCQDVRCGWRTSWALGIQLHPQGCHRLSDMCSFCISDRLACFSNAANSLNLLCKPLIFKALSPLVRTCLFQKNVEILSRERIKLSENFDSEKGQDLQAWTLWRGKRWRSIHDFALVWTFLILFIVHTCSSQESKPWVRRKRKDCKSTVKMRCSCGQRSNWCVPDYANISRDFTDCRGSVTCRSLHLMFDWLRGTFFASKLGGRGQSRHGLSKSVTLATDYVRCFRFLIPGHCQSAERRSSHVAVSRQNCTQQSPSWRARNFGTPAAEKHWKQVNMEKLKSLLRLRSTTLRFLQNLYIEKNNNPGWAALCTLCKVVLESQGRTLKFSIQEQSGELQIQGY